MNLKKLEGAYNQATNLCRILGRENQDYSASNKILEIYEQVRGTIQEQLNEDIGEPNLNPSNHDVYLGFVSATSIIAPHLSEVQELTESLIKASDLENFPGLLRNRIIEADTCYRHGCYTACCVLCGSILEAIINEKISLETKNEDVTLLNQFYIKYDLENEKKVLNEMRAWRNKSAHFSAMEFNENHAKIFINSLIIAVKKVYK